MSGIDAGVAEKTAGPVANAHGGAPRPEHLRPVSGNNDVALAATRAVIAGGGSSNLRNAGVPVPLVVKSASGCRLTDVEENELLDLNMGYGPHLFGYGDEEVLGAVSLQLTKATMTGLPHALDHQAGELIATLVPSVEQVRFANSGTEAVASAIRLARMITGRGTVATFEGHYHGWSETMLRPPASPEKRALGVQRPEPGAPGMIPEAHAHTLQLRFNDLEALEVLFSSHGDDLAAVILEPVCANSGVVLPDRAFLDRLVAKARSGGTLVIFDEVITGFRLARGGAQEVFGITPDLTILSKALGGGFPVAAFGGNREVMEPLASHSAFHAGVYAGGHLAMSAVVATLTKILRERELYSTLDERGNDLEQRVRKAFANVGLGARVVRAGSILSVGTLRHPTDRAEPTDCSVDRLDFDFHRRLQIECQARGVYFHPNPLEPWFISTAHSPLDIEEAEEVIVDALNALLS
jgi:glutamate-1-semialdehyde 2,1-aminomutase